MALFPFALRRAAARKISRFRVGPRGRPEGGWRRLTGVLRGGSWINNNPENLRAANRNDNHPANRNHNIGFRVVGVGESRKAGPAAKGRDVGWESLLPGQCQEAQPNSADLALHTRGKDAASAPASATVP